MPIKIEASSSGNAILIDGVPYNKGNIEIEPNNDQSRISFFHVRTNKEIIGYQPLSEFRDNNDNPFATFEDFVDYLDTFFFRSVGGGGSGIGFTYLASNYTDLITNVAPQPIDAGTLAYVFNEEGTKWLPGTIGGSYYPNGIYVSDGVDWTSDRNAIAEQLQINIDDIDQLQADLLQEIIDRTNGDASLQAQITAHVSDSLIHQPTLQIVSGARAAPNVTNQYLRTEDRMPMNLNGTRLNYDCTLIDILVTTNGNETWDAEVRANNNVAPIYTENVVASDFTRSSPGIDFDADDEVQFYCNGVGINRPQIIAVFERR